MVERNQHLNHTKQVIRSVIEANGNRISIRSLIKEYKDLTENDIPIASLGYDSVLELIQDCDDWFGIERTDAHSNEWQYVVYCRPLDNTRHLVDLIENQRKPENSDKVILRPSVCYNPFRSRPTADQRPRLVKPFKLEVIAKNNEQQTESDLNSGPYRLNLKGTKKQTCPYKSVCPLPDTRIITNELKIKISALMSKYKIIGLVNFEIIYKLFHGETLDYKRIGFVSVDQLLRAIPDVIHLKVTDNGPMVCYIVPETPSKRPEEVTQISNKTSNCVNTIANRDKELKNIRLLLKSYPKGIGVKRFVDLYQKIYKTLFVCENWGYSSPIEMFAKMTNIFVLEKNPNHSLHNEEWILFDTTCKLTSNGMKTSAPKKRFGDEFKENVNQVMHRIGRTQQKYIYVENFPSAYSVLFHENIEPKTYGFNDWKQLLLELSKECDFSVKERVKNKPFLVPINK